MLGAEIYHNTVFVTASASGTPRAVHVSNTGVPGSRPGSVHFRNNILQSSGGVPLVDVAASVVGGTPDIRFEGNAYSPSGGAFRIFWGAAAYTSLSGWRTTTQEVLGGQPVGVAADPRLTAGGSGGTADDATRLELVRAYELRDDSPVRAAGLDLRTLFNITDGGVDFFGTRLATRAGRPIGAAESSAAPPPLDIVRHAVEATIVAGAWQLVADPTAADSTKLANPNSGAARQSIASAAPASYFDMTVNVEAGRPYRLWVRGAASGNSWANDSVFVQFSGSVDAQGVATWRTGTTSAAEITIEDCTGCGLLGWGWQDNGSGVAVAGPFIYFAVSGTQTMRIQPREDGLSIDQIVLSPRTFLLRAPGAVRDDSTVVPSGPAASPVTTTSDVVIRAADVPASSIAGRWSRIADATAANGVALWNPNQGTAKLTQALAAPVSYFDASFQAQANVAYHLWLRLRAENNAAGNDPVYVQYSGAVNALGQPIRRIGTVDADAVVLQEGTDAPISGWGWNDNGWGTLGTPVVFATSGTQTIRIQQREDGALVDQDRSQPGAVCDDFTRNSDR